MKNLRLPVLVAAFLILATVWVWAGDDFPPVSPLELAMRTDPANPDAAEILYQPHDGTSYAACSNVLIHVTFPRAADGNFSTNTMSWRRERIDCANEFDMVVDSADYMYVVCRDRLTGELLMISEPRPPVGFVITVQ